MNIGYFPGCSLHATASDFSMSINAIMPILDINLMEIEDWNCCGASSAHKLDHTLSLSLPARNIALASRNNLNQILAPCAACYNRLISTHFELSADEKLRHEIEKVTELPYPKEIEILNLPELLFKYSKEKIQENVKKQIQLKAACYYGCLLTRPKKIIKFDDSEQPTSMENICELLGITPVDWGFKTECCGGSFSISDTEVVYKLTNEIIANALSEGADIIVTSCPLCHSNLDMRQAEITKRYKTKEIPILYLSQVIGYALGISPKKLGLNKHFTTKKLKELFR